MHTHTHTQNQYYSAVTFVSDIIIANTSIGIMAIFKHYFDLGLKAACRIWEMEGNKTKSQNYFRHFEVGDLSLETRHYKWTTISCQLWFKMKGKKPEHQNLKIPKRTRNIGRYMYSIT